MTQQECILTRIFNCASADLGILERINYDLDEMIDELMDNGCLSLSSLLESVFEKAKDDLNFAIEQKVEDLGNELNDLSTDDENYEDIKDELADLSSLSPKSDITYFINYLDTHIFIDSDKKETYENCLGEVIEEIEETIGFYFK